MKLLYNKNKMSIILGIFIILFGALGLLALEKFYINRIFSIHRFLIFMSCITLIGLSFIFEYKKMWNFIFCKRYYIGVIIFIFIVFNGYNGSSSSIYNAVVQPDINIEESKPFIGESRTIRSDEFIVTTPTVMSQKLHGNPIVNDAITAEGTNMQLFPLAQTNSISILGTPQYIGFQFLDLTRGYSFFWYLPIFILFFALMEVLMLFTKGNKLYSAIGSLLVVCSPALQWWNSYTIIAYGCCAVLMYYKFVKSETWKGKLLFSCLFGWFGACYIFTLYPAWMVPFAYFFLVIVIWVTYSNWKHMKISDLLYLIPATLIMAIILVPALIGGAEAYSVISNTVYPGNRSPEWGTSNKEYLNYYFSPFLSVKDSGLNQSEMAQFLSLYPLPIILGLWQSFKNFKLKRNDFLLNGLLVITIFMTAFNFLPLSLLAKLTLLSFSTAQRIQFVVSFLCLIIMILLLSNYAKEYELKKSFKYIFISVICSFGFVAIVYSIIHSQPHIDAYISNGMDVLAISYLTILVVVFLLNHKTLNYIFIVSSLMVCSLNLVTINPISKGLTAITDKPVAKEIQKLVAKEQDSRWLGVDCHVYMQNYALANGAKVVNSTNYFPNFKFWHTLDPKKKYENVYNRYSHITVEFTNEATFMKIYQTEDSVLIRMNTDDLIKLNVDYVISFSNDLQKYNTERIKLRSIYSESNVTIYRVEQK